MTLVWFPDPYDPWARSRSTYQVSHASWSIPVIAENKGLQTIAASWMQQKSLVSRARLSHVRRESLARETMQSGPRISCLVTSSDPPHPLWRDETSSHLHLSCRSICYGITNHVNQAINILLNVQSTNLQLSCCCIAVPPPSPLPVCMSQVYNCD